jgi:hypothetical protein
MSPKWVLNPKKCDIHSQTDNGYEQRNLYILPRIVSKSAEKHFIGLRMRLEMENKKSGRGGGAQIIQKL